MAVWSRFRANRKGFQASIDIGLEYSYSFRNGMQVFVMQKMILSFGHVTISEMDY